VQSTNRASAHRETLQVKYDEKLERIKDVCAQYFSKYER
jgi:peptide methionine sulfoxide reductase MsrA